MSQYYYAVASLPTLKPGEKPPISQERFLEIVRTNLSLHDLAVFEKAQLGNPSVTENDFLQSWFTWEKELKKELARFRLQRGGFENPTELPQTEGIYQMSDTVKNLLSRENPLEAEYQIDSLRWGFLENQLLGHYFDLETILAFSLKLQILQRQELFEKTLGQGNYHKTYQNIVQNLEINREIV